LCQAQDPNLFNRLCPKDKHGKQSFAPVMLRRLKKLGIEKTDPSELTPEEQVSDMPPPVEHAPFPIRS